MGSPWILGVRVGNGQEGAGAPPPVGVVGAITFARRRSVGLASQADVRYYVRIRVPSRESVLSRLRFTQDVRPVTEFRANASAFLDQVRETRRPVVLTQHGRSAAVLLNVEVYEGLLDEVALLRDIKTAEGQVAAGKTAAHASVAKRLRDKLLK